MKVPSAILILLIAFHQGSAESNKFMEYEGPIQHPDCPATENPFNPTLLPYPNDCTKFYKCSSGLAYPLNCPAGLHWSVSTNRCDWPSVAKCDKTFSLFVEPIHNDIIGRDKEINTIALNYLSDDSPIQNSKCPQSDDPEHPKHLPHSDCTKFYKCSNGYAYPMKCPAGQHWSIRLDRCDWPSVAQCEPNNETSTTTEPTRPTLPPTTPTSTRQTSTETSTWPTTVPTTIGTTNRPPLTEVCKTIDNVSLLPHPTDCTKFIQCNYGTGYIRQCPAGLHFSVRDKLCQWPGLANCQVASQ